MRSIRPFSYLTPARLLVCASAVLLFAGCYEDDPASPPTRVLTTVNVSLGSVAIEVGEMTTATAAGLDQHGSPIATGAVTWASDAMGIAGINPTSAPVDLSFWSIVGSNFFGASYTFPSGTSIPARGFLVVEESSLPFSIGVAENIHLFSRFGVGVDHARWLDQPATTLGHCPDGAGEPIVTTAPTKGTANACPPTEESLGTGSGEARAR